MIALGFGDEKSAEYDVMKSNKANIPDLGAQFHRSRYRGHSG